MIDGDHPAYQASDMTTPRRAPKRTRKAYGVLKGPTDVQAVELPETPDVLISVVADTHSRPHVAGLEHLKRLQPYRIIHGGDIGAATVLDQLETIAPVIAVRGNIDPMDMGLPATQIIHWTRGGQTCSTWLLTHIALRGPKLYAQVHEMAHHFGAQLVICGHSHVPFIGRDKNLAIFNPGSIGPRRFSLPITFGSVHMSPNGIDLVHVNCETGQPLRIEK